jgi:DNA repair exonuclease SbcCD ATPase subunit
MTLANYRIAGLTIEGFRGFTTPQSIVFNGRNVFIFGENGHGKSSIIEAIQWCLFGGSDIQVRNNVYEKQECRVSLRLEGRKGKLTFERDLRPGRTQSDRRLKDGRGNEVQLRDVFPQLAKLRSQYESTQVIFAAQQPASRRVTADITEFGRVLCFYLKLEDVPDLVRQMSHLIQERRSEAKDFAKQIEEIEHRYRQKHMAVQVQIDALLTNATWGDGPSPTATETSQRIVEFVQEIGSLVNQTCSASLRPGDMLQKGEEWVSLLAQEDIAEVQHNLGGLSQKIQKVEALLPEVRQASTLVTHATRKHRELLQQVNTVLAGSRREAIVEEIERREKAQTLGEARAEIAERVAKLCKEHALQTCPACGSTLDPGALALRTRTQPGAKGRLDSENIELEEARTRLRELDEAVEAQTAGKSALSAARNKRDTASKELATLLGQEPEQLDLQQIEPLLSRLKVDLAALQQRQTEHRDQKQELLSRIKVYRQELAYHRHREQLKELEKNLSVGMEEAHARLRNYEEFLRQVEELKQLIETAFKNALDSAIPPLNELLTEVYQRLTRQRSFELVRVHHDPERIGHLELRVGSNRRPDTDYPMNVLNGQASKALHLVPYFVFSRFQPELLELDLLLIDDPSESFDTSHVGLLIEELRIAAKHAQLIVASHEEEKFFPHLSAQFEPDSVMTMRVVDFDPEAGPRIERR